MKKYILAALPLLALFIMALQPAAIEPLPLGSALPNASTKMKDVSGKELSLGEIKTNKGLLVIFSCNTCPYVIKNQSRSYEVCKYAMGSGMGVAVLNSNEANRSGSESYNDMKAYANEQGYGWNYLVDENSTLANAFGANRTPECFLFDAAGKLVYHGAIDDNPSDAAAVSRKHLLVAIEEVLAGKEVSLKESRSVGCGIKRKG
jgi:thioredoxin-related protein